MTCRGASARGGRARGRRRGSRRPRGCGGERFLLARLRRRGGSLRDRSACDARRAGDRYAAARCGARDGPHATLRILPGPRLVHNLPGPPRPEERVSKPHKGERDSSRLCPACFLRACQRVKRFACLGRSSSAAAKAAVSVSVVTALPTRRVDLPTRGRRRRAQLGSGCADQPSGIDLDAPTAKTGVAGLGRAFVLHPTLVGALARRQRETQKTEDQSDWFGHVDVTLCEPSFAERCRRYLIELHGGR
jgi:hypothetical protein